MYVSMSHEGDMLRTILGRCMQDNGFSTKVYGVEEHGNHPGHVCVAVYVKRGEIN